METSPTTPISHLPYRGRPIYVSTSSRIMLLPLHVCREAGGVLDRVKEKARTRERKERKGRRNKKERREEVKRISEILVPGG